MCGIAAVHDLTGHPAPERLEAGRVVGEDMLSRLHHRGPDGHGSRQVARTWLGHTRLSIVDLDGGRQPLADDTGRRWVVANGEIYNHRELRAQLPGPFLTSSDSEVVLHVLSARGTDGIHDLRGMWAFCVADEDGGVWLARDPLGVKPLYWAHHDGRILVASELHAFAPDVRAHVEEFPPGHFWTPGTGLRQYVDLHARDDARGDARHFVTQDGAQQAVRETLVTAVRERMMADVPVGVFLSGGLDSSIVAAILARETRALDPTATVHSFAAGTEGSSDLVAARVVADDLGLEHHERVYTDQDVVDVLPTVVAVTESYEPSLVRSAVPNYLLAEMAARHVKVVLTGEGADELFAGYHHLRELDEDALQDALVDGVETLHHLNLQRCDRVTMAHGLEARVPFLAREMLAVAARVPIGWKLLGEDGQEKRLLREAFTGWVPHEILWRRKEQFGDGSGTTDAMNRVVESLVPDPDWAGVRLEGLPVARTREELAYQRIFAAHLGGIRAEQVLGRFATA